MSLSRLGEGRGGQGEGRWGPSEFGAVRGGHYGRRESVVVVGVDLGFLVEADESAFVEVDMNGSEGRRCCRARARERVEVEIEIFGAYQRRYC